jgi:hypothetical protein
MTVVRRDHLKDPHIARNALRGDALNSLSSNKISMTNKAPNLRPAGNRISVQPLSGNQVLLRNNGSTGFVRDGAQGREAGGRSTVSGPRAVRQPSAPASGTKAGSTAKPQSVKSPSGKSGPSGAGKAAGKTTAKTGSGVKKKADEPATAASSVTSYKSDPSLSRPVATTGQARTAYGYPSSPRIKGPSSYGDSGSGRARTFTGPYSQPRSYGGSSIARPSPSGSRGSSVRSSGSRSGSSSGRTSGTVSRGSSSRSGSSRSNGSRSSGSRSSGSSSRGSSGGSRGSSGGSVRKH